jgi:hypothetical protein
VRGVFSGWEWMGDRTEILGCVLAPKAYNGTSFRGSVTRTSSDEKLKARWRRLRSQKPSFIFSMRLSLFLSFRIV